MTSSAHNQALKLLGRRDFFAAELHRRLVDAGFADADAAAAVERCTATGLVDDSALAARFVELRGPRRGWGSRRLELELRKRGCPDDVARAAVAAATDPGGALDTALRRAEARLGHAWWQRDDRRARMVSSLIRRGFDADEARTAVAALTVEREREHDALDDEPGDPEHVP